MDITIHRVRLDNKSELFNIGIRNGKISVIQKEDLLPGELAFQANGKLISPAFIDPHFHLENCLLNQYVNKSGTLKEAIKIYSDIKQNIEISNVVDRATIALHEALINGTLWMRNHVDIDQVAQLRMLESIVKVKEKFENIIDIQIVAFPQMGLVRNEEAVDLMWQAMSSGANIVGGMPHGERDMDDAVRHIEIAFEIARKYNADIDMHIDETDDPKWQTLELLAEKTIEEGYQGRVTAGHCCAMAAWDDKYASKVISKVKDANLNIITNVPVNLFLQGRADKQPVRRGIPRVKELLEAGINVSCGQDDMANMFYPFGHMDMLEVANYVAHVAHLSSPIHINYAYDMPRYHAAETMGIGDYGIALGKTANLVLIDAETPLEALRRQPRRIVVIRNGQVLVEDKRQLNFSPIIPQ